MENLAIKYLENGYNCAESIILAYSQKLGIEKELAVKLCSGFCGGIANTKKYLCGAVNAGIVVLNIKYGGEDKKQKDLLEKKIKIFLTLLEMKHRSFLCKDLLIEDNIMYEINSQKCVSIMLQVCCALDKVLE